MGITSFRSAEGEELLVLEPSLQLSDLLVKSLIKGN